MGKATNLKFCSTFIASIGTKSPLKISAKVAMGVLRDSRKFSGHAYIGRIARSSLRQLSFLVFFLRHGVPGTSQCPEYVKIAYLIDLKIQQLGSHRGFKQGNSQLHRSDIHDAISTVSSPILSKKSQTRNTTTERGNKFS